MQWFSLFFLVLSLNGCGSLGAFEQIVLPIPKHQLKATLQRLHSEHPEYNIPEKWKMFNDWSKRGYEFLDSDLIYFSQEPEEMYYISYFTPQSDSTKVKVAIRAINVGNAKWFLQKDLDERIEARFRTEIITKIEKYAGCASEEPSI